MGVETNQCVPVNVMIHVLPGVVTSLITPRRTAKHLVWYIGPRLSLVQAGGRARVWCRANEVIDSSNQQGTVQTFVSFIIA